MPKYWMTLEEAENLSALVNAELPREYRCAPCPTKTDGKGGAASDDYFCSISHYKYYDGTGPNLDETISAYDYTVCTFQGLQGWENILKFVHSVVKFERSI